MVGPAATVSEKAPFCATALILSPPLTPPCACEDGNTLHAFAVASLVSVISIPATAGGNRTLSAAVATVVMRACAPVIRTPLACPPPAKAVILSCVESVVQPDDPPVPYPN